MIEEVIKDGLKIPPNSDEAERGVMGSIMLSPDASLDKCLEKGLTPDSFYMRHHRILFEQVCELSLTSRCMDAILIAEHLKDKGALEDAGGYDYLVQLQDPSVIPAHVEHYADILIDKHKARRGIRSCSEALAKLYKTDEVQEIIDNHILSIENITPDETRTTEDIINEALEIDEKISRGERIGLPLPWNARQLGTFGIPMKAVTPLAGRDGKGKSRLATFLSEFWVQSGIPILYFPFEDTGGRFATNFASTLGQYDAFRIKRRPTDKFMDTHRKCMRQVAKMPLFIEDSPTTAKDIARIIGQYKRKYGIEGVVIDGFKDIILPNGENQTTKEGEVMAELVRAAKKYNVAIITVMHLRDMEEKKWISKSEIRGNKTLTQSSRMTIIFQDSGIPSGMAAEHGLIEGEHIIVDVQKCSYGSKGWVALTPNLEQGRFDEVALRELN
jgi:replicative DNA helicase